MDELTIPGLSKHDIVISLNARNFAYYCDMIKNIRGNICPFCDPMDKEKNPIIMTFRGWRAWECPQKFRAKELSKQLLIGPTRHDSELSALTSEDFYELSLLLSILLRNLSGEILHPHFGGSKIGPKGVHAFIVVPNGNERVEAIFDTSSNKESFNSEEIQGFGNWICEREKPDIGFESKFLIEPTEQIKSFDKMSPADWDNLSQILSYLTDPELGLGLPGGAFVMGLPGAALVMRFGDPQRHAGSVRHLHCNIMIPNESNCVRATFAKDASKILKKMEVLKVWEKMRLHQEGQALVGNILNEQQLLNILNPEELETYSKHQG